MGEPRFDFVTAIPSQCTLAEGAVWDERTGALWFTDIQRRQLLRFEWEAQRLQRHDLPERLGSFGLTADRGELVCAFASGFAMYRPETAERRWLYHIAPAYRGMRMNDGRVDRQGRFWAGSMVEDEELAPPQRGTLYRLDHADGTPAAPMLDGITISNSTCFSPSGDRIYFTDSPTRQIMTYDLDPESGEISDPRTFACLSGKGYPDGSDVDAAGRLWNAEWGSGRVTAYNPDGSIWAQLDLPVSQATCVAFGGPELDLLFVTTARENLSHERLGKEPQAGDVLVYRTDTVGLAAPVFRG